MALVLKKEDGTGMVDANAYASAADGDAYHAGHLYASVWTAASTGGKEIALVMATRLIDAEYQFLGFKTTSGQSLQWPRARCPDRDHNSSVIAPLTVVGSNYLPENAVPRSVQDATCELARELLVADRTAAPVGEGLKYANVGTSQTGYDKKDTRPVIPALVQAMLAKLGSLIGRATAVRLQRV